jgi:hypothetical protein
MFRGVIVPQGNHVVSMKFTSTAFSLGKQLSLWVNILLLVGIGYSGLAIVYARKKL